MRKLLTLILIGATATGTDAAELWSLDSCINYAISHNLTIRSRQNDVTQAELSVTEAKDRFLPTLDAGASQSFNFGRGLTSDNTYADRNTSQFGWNLSMQLPLFQGLSAKRQLDYSRANLKAILESVEAAKEDVTLQVIAQYLQVLYAGEVHDVALEQLRISEVELERQQQLLEAGKIPELDMKQAQSQVAQDRMTVVTSENDRQLALVDLAQLLQLPSPEEFDIAPLPDSYRLMPSAETVYNNALQNNHTLRAAKLNIDAADRNISLSKAGYLPRLSFNAGLGSSYYTVSGYDNSTFSHQMRDNFNKSLGFTLSIPIFDAFSTRNSVRRARIQRTNAEIQYDEARNKLYQSIQQLYYQASGAEQKLEAAITAQQTAHEALNAMQEKYNFGKANATEFEQAKSTYVKASLELVQAKYERIIRIRMLDFYNRH